MIFETYCLLLALNSILIEKGIIEKDKLEAKRMKIMQLMISYSELMTSKKESEEIENKKLEELNNTCKELMSECCFEIATFSSQFVEQSFKNRVIEE